MRPALSAGDGGASKFELSHAARLRVGSVLLGRRNSPVLPLRDTLFVVRGLSCRSYGRFWGSKKVMI